MKPKQLTAIIVAIVIASGLAVFIMTGSDEEAVKMTTETSQAESKKSEETSLSSMVNIAQQKPGDELDCSLYTLEDLAGVWGVPMTDTDHEGSKVSEINGPQNHQYECDYNETDSGMGLSVSILYKVYEDETAAQASIADTRSGAKFDDTVYFVLDEVEGIGSEAFFSLPARQVDNPNNVEEQLYVRDRNVVYLISATNLSGVADDYRDKILATYRLKLANL